jgi:quinol monooxygenase YgiN
MPEPATPFGVAVRFTVRAGREAEFDDLAASTAEQVRSREPRARMYAWHRVEGSSRDRVLYGLWNDRASMLAHGGQPYARHFQDAREPLVEFTHADYLLGSEGKPAIGH